jgi:precorrin-6B methylase 2
MEKQKTAVEWLVEELKKIGFLTNNIVEFENQVQIAKEMEEKQRQEDKLTGMKEANELLDELIEKNMCSNSGDILIKQFKKRINL